MMTRENFIEAVGSVGAAIAFENQVLQIGREFLPECALQVVDGDEGDDRYWSFLIDMWNSMSQESQALVE